MKKQAFTLTEVLAVMAVIGLLASLLLPALARGKDKARQGVCTSNLRQLGIAAQLYWDDHGGRTFPYRAYATNNGDLYWFGWLERGPESRRNFDRRYGALAGYLSGNGIETCPSLPYSMAQFKLKATGAAYGYGYNLQLSSSLTAPARSVAQLAQPSLAALLADAAQVNTFQAPASPDHPMLEEFYYISPTEPTTHFRHAQRAEVLFCDTHIAARPAAPNSLDTRLPGQTIGTLDASAFTE